MRRSVVRGGILVLLGVFAIPFVQGNALRWRHPHYPKTVEMRLGTEPSSPTIAVEHITVTFNAEGFASAKPGATWHLGGAALELTGKTTIGGKTFEDGDYRLLARKVDDTSWELVVDPKGQAFRRELSDEAVAITTRFVDAQPVSEHLRCDIQPMGGKDATGIQLEVHFDQYAAFATVELAKE